MAGGGIFLKNGGELWLTGSSAAPSGSGMVAGLGTWFRVMVALEDPEGLLQLW